MTLIIHHNQMANWYDLVMKAQSDTQIYLDQELEVYLALLMNTSIKDNSMVNTIIALKYLKALNLERRQKATSLKKIAEQSLLLSTLFPKIIKRRNVPSSYYADMSQTAYQDLAILFQNHQPVLSNLYKKILNDFKAISKVLSAFRVVRFKHDMKQTFHKLLSSSHTIPSTTIN